MTIHNVEINNLHEKTYSTDIKAGLMCDITHIVECCKYSVSE